MIWEYLNLKIMQWKLVNGGYSGGYTGSYKGKSSPTYSSCGGSYTSTSYARSNSSSSYGNCGGYFSSTSYGSCSGGKTFNIINRINSSIKQNYDKKYNKDNDGYKCDNWVQEVLTDAKFDYNDYFAGDANRKEVKDHISNLKSKGEKFYTMKVPSKPGSYVVFMDGTGSLGTLAPHCGILQVNINGTMTFADNSSGNDAAGEGGGVLQYSTSAQLPTKLEGLAYSNFYFQEIKQ